MKLKEIDRNGIISFSPSSLSATYLAIGTSLHQLDQSFNSQSQLDIFEYNPSLNGLDMELKQTLALDRKLAKLVWSGNSREGLIISGGEAGSVALYDPGDSLKDKKQPIVRLFDKQAHKGAVNALDNNKSVKNLFASGSTESEIFIWDIEKLEEPVELEDKSQAQEDILGLAWNHKVEQVLGSVSCHRCQVWDLRKTSPVIKLSDTQMKMRPKKMLWHPEISRRLCLVSNDDQIPSIQMWDLRYLQFPYHTIHHTAPIIDIDWCMDDSDILVAVTKDDYVICYDMATHPAIIPSTQHANVSDTQSEVLYKHRFECQQSLREVKFCPKHPSVIAVSSLHSHLSLYSLMGGVSQSHISSNQFASVSDSFPLDDEVDEQHADEFELIKREVEKEAAKQLMPYPSLSRAPKWLRRPCGASFSFGNKLVQWSKPDTPRSRTNSLNQSDARHESVGNARGHRVFISRVNSMKPELLDQSLNLNRVLQGSQDDLIQFCDERMNAGADSNTGDADGANAEWESCLWRFISCHLMEDSRVAFVKSLGYDKKLDNEDDADSDRETDTKSPSIDSNDQQEVGESDSGGGELSLLPTTSEYEKDMAISLMTGDIEGAVNLCLEHEKYGEACILAVSSGQQELYDKVQHNVILSLRAQNSQKGDSPSLIEVAVKHDWHGLVSRCELCNWREALVWLMTYCNEEEDELQLLCIQLGTRLCSEQMILPAAVAFVCGGSVSHFMDCLLLQHGAVAFSVPECTQKIVEMVLILVRATSEAESAGANKLDLSDESRQLFVHYCEMLVSLGYNSGALQHLTNLSQSRDGGSRQHMLAHRLTRHLGGDAQPPFPVMTLFKSAPANTPRRMPPRDTSGDMARVVPPTAPSAASHSYSDNTSRISHNLLRPATIPNSNYQLPRQSPSHNAASFFTPAAVAAIQQPPVLPAHTPAAIAPILPTSPVQPCRITAVPASDSLAFGAARSVTAKSGQSGWNDPPILSDAYCDEKRGGGSDIGSMNAHKFYNPNDFSSGARSAPGGQLPMRVPHSNNRNAASNGGITPIAAGEKKAAQMHACDTEKFEAIKICLLELLSNCRLRDTSRMSKVKLDEFERKIAGWFANLSGMRVSEELYRGLCDVCDSVRQGEYKQGLARVNSLIGTVSFSEASSFLPALKMFMQTSNKIMAA